MLILIFISASPANTAVLQNSISKKDIILPVLISCPFVQLLKLLHLVFRKLKIPYIVVFCNMFRIGASRYRDIAGLDMPSDNDLGRTLSMSFCNRKNCRVLQVLLDMATAAEWIPAFYIDTLL